MPSWSHWIHHQVISSQPNPWIDATLVQQWAWRVHNRNLHGLGITDGRWCCGVPMGSPLWMEKDLTGLAEEYISVLTFMVHFMQWTLTPLATLFECQQLGAHLNYHDCAKWSASFKPGWKEIFVGTGRDGIEVLLGWVGPWMGVISVPMHVSVIHNDVNGYVWCRAEVAWCRKTNCSTSPQ